MTVKHRPEAPNPASGTAAPGGYRTLVPGEGEAPKPVPPKAPVTPAATKPAAAKPDPAAKPAPEKPHDDPTRFGDWEVKGRCIDF